ncbi:MAG: dihydrofolate reductase [Verrucomicrobiota bacterium]
MLVSLIAAVSSDGYIARKGGGIPWSLPRDKAHFRSYTRGKWMLVGRRTYEEMTGWFGDRIPIVLSESEEKLNLPTSHLGASSVAEAVSLAQSSGASELVVSGGAAVYEAAGTQIQLQILTRVDFEIGEGVAFPSLPGEWIRTYREDWPADDENPYEASFEVLERSEDSGSCTARTGGPV